MIRPFDPGSKRSGAAGSALKEIEGSGGFGVGGGLDLLSESSASDAPNCLSLVGLSVVSESSLASEELDEAEVAAKFCAGRFGFSCLV